MAKEKPGVMMYWETFDVLEALLDGQAKTMLRAIRNYSQYGEAPDFGCDTVLATLWMLFQPKLDADNERYERIRKQRTDAINARWRKEREQHTDEYGSIQEYTDEYETYESIRNIPTTTATTEATTASTANPEANPKAKSNPKPKAKSNPVYEGRRDCAGAHSVPRTDLPSVALTPEQEAENERLRKEAMDKLRGWQG